MFDTADLTELGAFLRQRRESLTPAEAGGRRRTPGLRREEVAALAHVSVTYYERLEQARGPRPSATVLAALTHALRLTPGQHAQLYRLAGRAMPVAPEPSGFVDPGLASVLTAVETTTPGFISDELGVVVAQNTLNVALFGRLAGCPAREANLVWRWFTSPEWRLRLEPEEQHEQTGRAYVADLRAVVAQRDGDPQATTLVTQLREVSPEFAAFWAEHDSSVLHCSAKRVHDERVGRLDLDCVVMLSPLSRQRMLLLRPVPGTGTAERLTELHKLVRP